MKKLFALILVVAMLLPCLAVGEVDVSGMTDQELKDLISACSSELRQRATDPVAGILIFEFKDVKVYQTGDAYIDWSGSLRIPVAVYNDMDHEMVISVEGVVCNGWDIWGGNCRASGKAKHKDEITFNINEADLTNIEDIDSLSFVWQVYDYDALEKVYEQTEAEEHRFW